MAFNTQALLLLISISCLLLSVSAQSYDDLSPAPSPSLVDEPDQTISMDSATAEASEPLTAFGIFETSKAVETPDVSVGSLTTSKALETEGQVFKFVETSMIGTMYKIEQIVDTIQKRLDESSSSDSTEGLQQCKEVYQDALDDAKNILDDLSSRDLYKANVDLSAISTNVDSCEEAYKELAGGDAHFHKFGVWVRGMTGNCLDALQKFSS